MLEILAQEAEEEAELTVEVAETCAELGPFCDLLLDWTGNETVSSTVAWALGTPLKIVIISIVALLLNRFSRRAIRRLTEAIWWDLFVDIVNLTMIWYADLLGSPTWHGPTSPRTR